METKVKPVPDGFQTANVYLTAADLSRQIAFLQQAFGAVELGRSSMPDGSIIHADVQIGTSRVMIGAANEAWPPRPSSIYLYVEDSDAAFRAAIAAGGKPLMEVSTQFYGDRIGGVEDPCGNYWWIATHVEDVSREESNRRFSAMGYKH